MTTYYVDGAVGNDGNAGTSEGAGNAWATIDHAMNTVVADDKVFVKASATYAENATIDTAGGFGTPIVFEGYTSTPGDHGLVTHNAGASSACITSAATSGVHYIFLNFDWNGSTGTASCVDAANADNMTFVNCKAHNSSVYGFNVDQTCMFMNCEVYSNTFYGISCDVNSKAIGCIAHSNGWEQFNCAGDWKILYKCVAYNPGSGRDLIRAQGNDITEGVIACTLDGDNDGSCVGIEATNESDALFIDNIVYDCATGMDLGSTFYETAGGIVCHNLVNSNTTDYSVASEELIGHKDVTGAPAFTDEAGDDYTLGDGSPAIDAGITPGTF